MKSNPVNISAERIVLGIEYDGSSYHGWQRQPHASSVQSTLEDGLSQVAAEKISVTCAGRTDTGVHATSQVVHFDCINKRPLQAWLRGANSLLPASISIRYAQTVSEQFHARFSAESRSYLYIIDNSFIRPAIMSHGLTWYSRKLDIEQMNIACDYFPPEQDFSSFRSSRCQSHTAIRHITKLQCRRINHYIVIEITANAFLHHMVRNIVGVLLAIGDGRKQPIWAKQVLDAKDRRLAGETANANGLYLVGVTYPEQFDLPRDNKYPLFLQQMK